MDDDNTIKPDDLCMVVRNTTGHACVEKDIGRPVTVRERFRTPVLSSPSPGVIGIRLVPYWTIAEIKCPHCGGTRDGYPEAGLQKLRGPRQGQDAPAHEPKVVGVDHGRPATADEAARMLEALR